MVAGSLRCDTPHSMPIAPPDLAPTLPAILGILDQPRPAQRPSRGFVARMNALANAPSRVAMASSMEVPGGS